MQHVYVLDQHGQPLMPCQPRKARLLLQSNRAHVAKRTPFTIQLDYPTGKKLQHVTLGVDAGSKTIGVSASTETHELLAINMYPRNDVVKLLSARRELRRSRRNRKTRYRKPRFNNRVKSKHKGWLAPSVEVKINNHLQVIKLAMKLLPVDSIYIETAEFDLQRLKAMEEGKPLPVGTDYQLGEQHDYYNVRQYVLHRDSYKCRYCGAYKNVKFHVHHLESRQTGGNRPANLITLCEACHKGVHKGKIDVSKLKKGRNYRDAAFMGVMRKTLIHEIKTLCPNMPVSETYGYITKYLREKHKLTKTHITDALCIARHPDAIRCDNVYNMKPFRSHNRQLHKTNPGKNGLRQRTQSTKIIKGFKLFDKVRFGKTDCFIWGKRTSGHFALRLIDRTLISASKGCKYLQLLERNNNYIIQQQQQKGGRAAPPHS